MQRTLKRRATRIVLISLGILLGLVAIVIIFISPITKYLVEKYDVAYTGREIKMDWAYVNPFTGYAYFSNFRIFEKDDPDLAISGDSAFLSCDGVGVHYSIPKMLRKNYEIKGLTLYKPRWIVIQTEDKHVFNFTDLIDKFSQKDSNATEEKEPVHFSLTDINIRNGEFHFRQPSIPINYFIKQVEIESTGYKWDVDSLSAKYSFVAGIGSGEMKGDFTMHLEDHEYKFSSVVRKYDLNLIDQYMKDLSNYGTMRAFLDADIKARGDFNDALALAAKGEMVISDFHFGKNPNQDYASFKKLAIGMIDVNPYNNVFNYDTLLLDEPYFLYEKYDYLDNIQHIFGKGGSNVKEAHNDPTHFNLILEIADYVKKLVKNFFRSEYRVNHFEIAKANFRYSDFSINEKFSAAVKPLTVVADSVDKKRPRARMTLKTGLDPYGHAHLNLSVNPKDSSDFDLAYNIDKVPVALFNPYLVTYTSYNMDRGTIQLKGEWHVRNGEIKSSNHLLVLDPRINGRVKKKDGKWIPMPLVMALVRERGNVIDYDIPITGDLKNPRFHISDVLLDLLKNIFIKPPTTPYGVKVSENEKEVEHALAFKWDLRQTALKWTQERFLNKVAEFFAKHPEASITVYPVGYADKEKEHILLYEAKKKYFTEQHKESRIAIVGDSLQVVKMSVKDKGFTKYLDQHGGQGLFTVQEKCRRVIKASLVEREFELLNKRREDSFLSIFKKNGVAGRVHIKREKEQVPYNGFSFFRIVYNGNMPDELKDAYRELSELDEEYPRSKYQRERNKIREFFKLTNSH